MIDDRLLFAQKNLATVGDLADVEAVLEDVSERPQPKSGRLDRYAILPILALGISPRR